ncbi:hypothetical protein [Pseudoflavonifractor sp. MCC625]|uniref:hypothetical protein n=1 Tax=Pseudoflavonifractor sp. MCC625 TaxID=2592647 RepID=UPI001C023391|nr:hypothetical protein [Pseudoflavonifractor sp. MCC625]MBT9683306.1 hypothetical protein [Pseudoflavonifractor sp. MCC625]
MKPFRAWLRRHMALWGGVCLAGMIAGGLWMEHRALPGGILVLGCMVLLLAGGMLALGGGERCPNCGSRARAYRGGVSAPLRRCPRCGAILDPERPLPSRRER